jgi:putative DNA primase/helicase
MSDVDRDDKDPTLRVRTLVPANDFPAAARVYRASVRPTLIYGRDAWYDYNNGAYEQVDADILIDEIWCHSDTWRVHQGEATAAYRPTNGKVANILSALRSECRADIPSSSGWLTADHPYPADEMIAFPNGLLHWPSGTFLPSTPSYFTTHGLAAAYDPTAPSSTAFERFLFSIWGDGEEIQTCQEIIGYLASGDNRFGKAFQIVGPSHSGKSTLLNVIGAIAPANCCTATIDSLNSRYGLAPLMGKTLAILGDNRVGRSPDCTAALVNLLRITGNDLVHVEPKFQKAVSVRLPTRFLFAGNTPLDLGDHLGAWKNRLITLVTGTSFEGREDPEQLNKLLAELPGILPWAIEGYRRLRQRGRFIEPARSAQALVALKRKSDPLSTFISERCLLGREFVTDKSVVYGAWCEWCDELNQGPGSQSQFGRCLLELYPCIRSTKLRRGNNRYQAYQGITVRVTAPID